MTPRRLRRRLRCGAASRCAAELPNDTMLRGLLEIADPINLLGKMQIWPTGFSRRRTTAQRKLPASQKLLCVLGAPLRRASVLRQLRHSGGRKRHHSGTR
jgi:hypothetical protein